MGTERKAKAGSLKWLRCLYNDLNKDYYEKSLPKISIEWAELPGTIIARVRWSRTGDGQFKPYVMQFSRMLKDKRLQKQVGMSMLHEMAHLKCGVEVDCREWDGAFDKEMFRLAAAGAFRLFW